MVTQALTSPCLLLLVPAGDFRRVLVRDGEGVESLVWPAHTP
jgi:hypothetical protein